MKRKKLSALVLAAVVGVSSAAFAACGSSKNQDPNTVRISRWALEWEKDVFRSWSKAFTDANPDIKIDWEFTPYTAHFDRLRTDLLGGTAADIIFVNNWGWKPYSKLDVFEDLGAVAELDAARNNLIGTAKDAFKQGDKTLGIPVGLVSRVPVVNAADFAAASAEIPYWRETSFTGSELTALLGDVADRAGRAMGLNITLTDALYQFTASVGAPIITPNNTIGCNTPAGIQAVQEFYEFATSGRVVPLAQSQGGMYGTPDTAMMTGQVVAGYTNPGGIKSLTEAGYGIAAIPSVKAVGGDDVVLSDFNTLVVPKFSKSKEAAYRVMNWMLSKDAQLAYAKFSDLPTNQDAFESVMTDHANWDPQIYGAFGVGIDNLYVPPALSTDFQTLLGGALKNLIDGAINAQGFCAKLATDGPKYL